MKNLAEMNIVLCFVQLKRLDFSLPHMSNLTRHALAIEKTYQLSAEVIRKQQPL